MVCCLVVEWDVDVDGEDECYDVQFECCGEVVEEFFCYWLIGLDGCVEVVLEQVCYLDEVLFDEGFVEVVQFVDFGDGFWCGFFVEEGDCGVVGQGFDLGEQQDVEFEQGGDEEQQLFVDGVQYRVFC